MIGALPVFSEGSHTSSTSASGSAMATATATATALSTASSSSSSKCRYKTGKCNNARSSKRNGQPHQLCLYHREKANRIQRKFDRQKRQIARAKKMAIGSLIKARADVYDGMASPHFAALSCQEVDIYSDSDSSRFSTDSESSVILDQSFWQDLPKTACVFDVEPAVIDAAEADLTEPVLEENNQGHLSHEEIDFLCSAMLE